MMNLTYLAQGVSIGGMTITGPLDPKLDSLGAITSRIMIFIIPIAAVILFFVLVWGGYDFMMSQGNPEKIKSGQAKLTTGLIGFILLIASFVIVRIIASIFGFSGGII